MQGKIRSNSNEERLAIKLEVLPSFSMLKTIAMASDTGARLVSTLLRNQNKFAPILGFALTPGNARVLDLSVHNKELQKCSNHEDYTKTLDHRNFIW